MPRLITRATRTTRDIHAPWWNPLRTSDGTLNGTPVTDPEQPGRYVERVVIYAEFTQGDQDAITGQIFKSGVRLSVKGGQEIPPEAMVATRAATFKRLIVGITDDQGREFPLTDDAIKCLAVQDADFIESELNKLKEPAVPVLPDHVQEAADEAAAAQAKMDAGFPVRSIPAPRSAEEIAQADFRPVPEADAQG